MLAVVPEGHEAHHPRSFLVRGRLLPSPEVPERAERLAAALHDAGHDLIRSDPTGPGPRAAVHTPEYLAFLETGWRRWQALRDPGPEIVPNIHPGPLFDSYPEGIVGQAGWHMADTACPIGPGTWEAACAAADAAVHAAWYVLQGVPAAYALCRPPGHHAFADRAGGFCYLNNTAIAAQVLAGHDAARVAILDIDVHHGNGTQGIFYRRGDVLTVSIHREPGDFYPFFSGYAAERGDGTGLGANLNLPLPQGTGDRDYLIALDGALGAIRIFEPDHLVVALGLDAFAGDPFAALAVTTAGFVEIGRRIAGLGVPTVLVQEGGYLTPSLGDNLAAILRGFEAGRVI